jgi:hypothetical protein
MTQTKLIVIVLAAITIEIASTFYITAVAEKQTLQMMFWAFVGPYIGLPFIAWQIEAKNWKERIILATAYGFGYMIGALTVSQFLPKG